MAVWRRAERGVPEEASKGRGCGVSDEERVALEIQLAKNVGRAGTVVPRLLGSAVGGGTILPPWPVWVLWSVCLWVLCCVCWVLWVTDEGSG